MIKNSRTPGGKQRWECRSGAGDRTHCYTTTNPQGKDVNTQSGKKTPGSKPLKFKRKLAGTRRFFITAAQNATPVHQGFLKALQVACEHLNAELLVVPIRYKNPTSRWSASQSNAETWASELAPYLYNQRVKLNKNLILLADVKTQPTASSPLTGFEALTHGESGILAHTKLQLKTVPTPQSSMAKILTTTGACTVPNYTDSRAGALGAFHHTLGACLVELDGKKFHVRQINADKDDGDFIDLDTHYSISCVADAQASLALVTGDTHVDFVDPEVVAATFGKNGIVDTLRPTRLVWHDLLDSYTGNPHHDGNVFNAIAKMANDRNDYAAEVNRAINFLFKHTPPDVKSIVVPSNHNDFLTRWIIGSDWRLVPENAEFYLETALAMVKGTGLDESGLVCPDPFTHWGKQALPSTRFEFLNRDDSYTVDGIELAMHGDKGPNGSRGSIKNLRRIGVKSIIGHTHSPGIDEGCYQVGTSTRLKLEYMSGPSGWLNTHCVVYANGKRSLINIIDGEWRI